MSRIADLVADVQANLNPTERLPDQARERWPGAASHNSNTISEQIWIDVPNGHDPSPASLDEQDSLEPFDSPPLGFPERVDGEAAIEQATPADPEIDALAYYLPFHFYRQWGIYIKESGLLALTRALDDELSPGWKSCISPDDRLQFACMILLNHEKFHFQTEVACSRLQHSHAPANWLYPNFVENSHPAVMEEALANAYALNMTMKSKGAAVRALRAACKAFLRNCGPGYGDFRRYQGAGFASGKDELVDEMASVGAGRQQINLTPGRLLYRDMRVTDCPIYFVRNLGCSVISPIRYFPRYGPLRVWVYTNDHRPPHVHSGSGQGQKPDYRFEWPSRRNMDGAPPRVTRQFEAYADRYAADITAKVSRIDWT